MNTTQQVFRASSAIGVILFLNTLVWLFFILLQKKSKKKLYKAAYIDPLTNCNNAIKFRHDAQNLLRHRKKLNYAVIVCDLNGFKIINDLYGYERGNHVLINVCKIISKSIHKKETFSRYYGDEYRMLLTYTDSNELIQRIEDIRQQAVINAGVPNLSISFGVYVIRDYSLAIEQMAIYAGMAKDTVKGIKEHTVGFFNEEVRKHLLHDRELEDASEQAFANHEFLVYLQPKYDASSRQIGGAEALVRWSSNQFGFISPGDFIPLFEKNHMIIELDNYMLNEVCHIQQIWMNEGKELTTISVNLSRVHLTSKTLIYDIINIVDSYHIPHKCIEFELTESAFFENKEQLLNIVYALQANDFLVSMDDFGSGYSSLNSLKDLPLDVIKLDGEFFKDTKNVERSKTVIRDTIAMAKHLEMKIVAEGVETKEQVDLLNSLGCDLIQGYYFARPMPVDDFEKKCYRPTESLETH